MPTDALRIWRSLADPTRWQIVVALVDGPLTTGQLARRFPQTRFAVMKHLDVLVAAELVLVERRGRERWNHLNPAPLVDAVDTLTTSLARRWSASLSSLRRVVEDQEDPMTEPEATPSGSPLELVDIRQRIRLSAPPARVFDVLTRDVDRWWTAPYRMTDGGRMRFEVRPGGELREEATDARHPGRTHVAVWGRVEELAAPHLVVLGGTFGMRDAVAGRVRIELLPDDDGTVLTLEHRAVGPTTAETAAQYGAGWTELLDRRLRHALEAA